MRSYFVPIAACVALVASACGPSAQPSTSPGGPSNVTVATPPPAVAAQPTQATAAAQPTQQTAPQPSGAQQVTVNALQGEPDTLDPSRSSFAPEAAVIRQVFEPLLAFDKDLKPAPAAAASFDISPDGKTYTFHLRPGNKWSDGQPVTAKDFAYSFRRILDPATAAEYASFFTDAGIVGAADFNAGKGSADNLGIKAVDDNTLQIQLESSIGYFPNLVALWVVPPIRQDIVQK